MEPHDQSRKTQNTLSHRVRHPLWLTASYLRDFCQFHLYGRLATRPTKTWLPHNRGSAQPASTCSLKSDRQGIVVEWSHKVRGDSFISSSQIIRWFWTVRNYSHGSFHWAMFFYVARLFRVGKSLHIWQPRIQGFGYFL
jgi:hypothetical protein